MQPGPTAVSGAAFAGNLPTDAARTAEAPGRRAEPAAQADSTGPSRVGHSVSSGSAPSPSPREPPPTSLHPETPRPGQQEDRGGQQEPPPQGRGQAGAGESLKAHERGRPGAGAQAQLRAEAVHTSRAHFAGPEGPVPVLQPGRPRPLCVLNVFSRNTAPRRRTWAGELPNLQMGNAGTQGRRDTAELWGRFYPAWPPTLLGICGMRLMGGREGHWPPRTLVRCQLYPPLHTHWSPAPHERAIPGHLRQNK